MNQQKKYKTCSSAQPRPSMRHTEPNRHWLTAQQLAQLNREAQLPADPFQLKFAVKARMESEVG